MIGDGADAILLQGSGHLIALVPRQAVDDATFATEPLVDDVGHFRQHVGFHLVGHHAVLQVGSVERS